MEQLKLSNNTAKLHQMFGKKLYASKFSFISEICQNAVDSHRMAGVKEPVEIGIKYSGRGPMFFVKDIGLSFDSKEDFIEKVCTLLESGKTESKTNDEDCAMGMHGIGTISVSAYQDTWEYTVVKNGRKFLAELKEVEGKGLMYDLSDYAPTEEADYVLFEVAVRYVGMADLVNAMRAKLAYFKDIMFVFPEDLVRGNSSMALMNSDFQIFQSDDFQISTLSEMKEMHLCVDQYSYRIRWDKVGISPISLNIGLKFGMADGLTPNITREDLILDENYGKIIREKIEKVADWFVNRYNSTVPDEFTDFGDFASKYAKQPIVDVCDRIYNIVDLSRHATVKIKPVMFKGVSDAVAEKFMNKTYCGKQLCLLTHQISPKGIKVPRDTSLSYSFRENVSRDMRILTSGNGKVSQELNTYFKSKPGLQFYRRVKIPLKLATRTYSDNSYFSYLLLPPKKTMRDAYMKTGVNIWRENIKQFQILEDAAIKHYYTSVSEVVIPPTFKPLKATKTRYVKSKEEIGIKYPVSLEKWSHEFICKWEEKVLPLDDVYKLPHLHVYGVESERKTLDLLMRITGAFGRKNSIMPCIIMATQQKQLAKTRKLHNFMSVEDFFKGKHRLFNRVMTAFLINRDILIEHRSLLANRDIIRNFISPTFAAELDTLLNYVSKYNPENNSDKFLESCLQLAEANKLYDYSIFDTYKRVKKEIKRYDFVNFFRNHINTHASTSSLSPAQKAPVETMQQIAKYRKIRMHWTYYNMFKQPKV